MIVIATEYERDLCPAGHEDEKVIITGVGVLNVISALKDIDKNEPVYNVGYAGSNSLPVGERVRIGEVEWYHPNVEFESKKYMLDGNVKCYTAGDFVTKNTVSSPCVFDMELAVILALGFKNVIAEKIVSDSLSVEDFDEYRNKQK